VGLVWEYRNIPINSWLEQRSTLRQTIFLKEEHLASLNELHTVLFIKEPTALSSSLEHADALEGIRQTNNSLIDLSMPENFDLELVSSLDLLPGYLARTALRERAFGG
jgi:hypothetical protein